MERAEDSDDAEWRGDTGTGGGRRTGPKYAAALPASSPVKFVDYVTISVRSGKGGAGAVAFRRAKYEPRGGPWGGNGGAGGSVVLVADKSLYTLLDLRYNRHHFAANGDPGEGGDRSGRDGGDIVLGVPLGTIARDGTTNEILGELIEVGDRLTLAQGGRGGRGNAFFKTSTNQAPEHAQPGEAGEEREVTLELKLLADVGLVGFPNAGKSTLVGALSAARPKVADYPFTTLEPSLGVVRVGDYGSFVIADIPGLIEGASEGKGLGTRFLKHIERNAVLLFTLPLMRDEAEADVAADYATLLGELGAFSDELMDKPRALVITKTDLVAPDDLDARLAEIRASLPTGHAVHAVSAATGAGLDALTRSLYDLVRYEREGV